MSFCNQIVNFVAGEGGVAGRKEEIMYKIDKIGHLNMSKIVPGSRQGRIDFDEKCLL
jgi:hypothetical protein